MTADQSYERLILDLRRIEEEAAALARLTDDPSPVDIPSAIALVRRWIHMPMDHKPRCSYRYVSGTGGSIRAHDRTGFFVWLTANLQTEIYVWMTIEQPALADVFRNQFLEVAESEYRHLSTMSGSALACCLGRSLARGMKELTNRVIGEMLSVSN